MKRWIFGCLSLLVVFLVILGALSYFLVMYQARYDIFGTITDTRGNPLNGVYLDRTYDVRGTMTPLVRSRETLDSEFHLSGTRATFLDLKFVKKGYYPEELSLRIDHLWFIKKIQIRMKPSEQMGIADFPTFQFEEKQKYICDLSTMDDGEVQAKFVDLETDLQTMHLEIDLIRDADGNVVYNGMESSGSDPIPAGFVIRLHSSDPDDGLILVPGTRSLTVDEAFRKKDISRQVVPKTGYQQKEIVTEMPSSWNLDVVFYLKCGDHFGKGELFIPPAFSPLSQIDKAKVTLQFELDINKEKDDRILRSELEDDYVPHDYY